MRLLGSEGRRRRNPETSATARRGLRGGGVGADGGLPLLAPRAVWVEVGHLANADGAVA